MPLPADPALRIEEIDARSARPSVNVRVSVHLPIGSPANSLTEGHFQVLEDGYEVPQITVSPQKRDRDILHLIVSFDSSRSITPALHGRMKHVVREILSRTGPEDRVALYRFNDRVTLLSDFSSPRGEFLKNLELIRRHGTKTLLYNAIYDSLERLGRDDGVRRAVVVFTDGRDEGSSVTADDVIRLSRSSRIPVHIVCPAPVCKTDVMERIARMSGGSLVSSTARGCVAGITGSLSKPSTGEYLITYPTTLLPDGQSHRLEVRFRNGTVSDRDTGSFLMERGVPEIKTSNLMEIMLISLILVLIILLAVVIAVIIRNGTKFFVPAPAAAQAERPRWIKSAGTEHRDTPVASPTITPSDPEYAYARAWLLMKDGPDTGKKFPIFWDEFTMGRDEGNTVVIRDQAVSLSHAKIKRIKDTYMLFDLVSENGTLLNGRKLLRPKALCDWDEIRIGRTVLVFRGSKIKD